MLNAWTGAQQHVSAGSQPPALMQQLAKFKQVAPAEAWCSPPVTLGTDDPEHRCDIGQLSAYVLCCRASADWRMGPVDSSGQKHCLSNEGVSTCVYVGGGAGITCNNRVMIAHDL